MNARSTTKKVIGYVSGVFDTFHDGHRIYLSSCQSNCDLLYCGVESDIRVKRRKGSDRPYYNEEKRLLTVSINLRFRDVVFLKNKKSDHYLSVINPHIVFTSDKTENSDSTLEYVKSNNIKLITFKYTDEISTTIILNKLVK